MLVAYFIVAKSEGFAEKETYTKVNKDRCNSWLHVISLHNFSQPLFWRLIIKDE
jgi:ABC-type nitrate/sulfonate/bicarbonate transport system substrate-binding protein